MAKTKRRKKPVAKKKPPPQVYVGPNIGGEYMLAQNSVYRGGLGARIESLIVTHPELKVMFVPVDQLSKVRARIRDKKSGWAGRYRAVQTLKKIK